MAVAKSAVGTFGTDSASNAVHVESAGTITVGASDTFLLLIQSVDTSTPGTVTTHWDNGGTAQLMTLIGSLATNSAGSPAQTIGLWGRVNPTPGAKKFDWQWGGLGAGSVNSYHVAISFTGSSTVSVAAATYGFNSASANQASGSSISIATSASINSGDMAVGAINDINGASAINGTSIGIDTASTTNIAASYQSGIGAALTTTGTYSTPDQYVAVTIGIAAPAAAAAPVLATARRVFLRRHHRPFAVPRQIDRNRIVGWSAGLILPRRSLVLPQGFKRAA